MKADAEANADEDRKRRESVETRNQADNVLYQSEKFLKENGDKVPGEQKQQLEDATKTLEEALKGSGFLAKVLIWESQVSFPKIVFLYRERGKS